jgi:hypothetical protein
MTIPPSSMAIRRLCTAIGDAAGAQEMATEAARWQRRVCQSVENDAHHSLWHMA